jgi:predicted permease
MSLLDAFHHRLSVLLHPRRYASDAEEEMRFHLELETMQQLHAGADEDVARHTARRRFGNVTCITEERRRMSGLSAIDNVTQDLRYALRSLGRNRGFSVAAVLTLALGIGATTAMFSLMNALLFRPLPVAEPDRLFIINEQRVGAIVRWMGAEEMIPYERFLQYREATSSVFTGLAAWKPASFSLHAGSDPATTVQGALVSANYFDVLGLRAAAGRFAHGDGERAVVISYRYWTTRFQSDPQAIGEVLYLDSRPYTVVGVAPQGFNGTSVVLDLDLWVPALSTGAGNEGISMGSWLLPFGRLRPGVDVTRASAVVNAVAVRTPPGEPQSRVHGARVEPLSAFPSGGRPGMVRDIGMFLVAATLVLLIACANIAGMLLARSVTRAREIAVRLAIGASRGRLVRQLIIESAPIFVMGGGGGLLVTLWFARTLAAWGPELPNGVVLDLSPDLRVYGFALVLSVTTGILIALLPALRASRTELVGALKDGAARGSASTRGRSIFVAGQLALSVVLLVAAGLFVRTLRQALMTDPGFDPTDVTVASIDLDRHGYSEERGRAFYATLTEKLRAVAGVESVGLARYILLSGGVERNDIEAGDSGSGERIHSNATLSAAGPGYFRTLRLPVVAGRAFTKADVAGSAPVVAVNETLARQLWPGQSPLGKQLHTFDRDFEVVGVLRDGKYGTIDEEPYPFMLFPISQRYRGTMTLHVRSRLPAPELIARIRDEVRKLDPNVAVEDAKPLDDVIAMTLLPQRFAAWIIGVFGVMGLFLAAIGIYAVLAYHVAQHTREFGIRLALGARGSEVLLLVMRRAVIIVAAGTAVGLAAAAGLTRILAGQLYGVSPLDPLTFTAAPLTLAAFALVASYIPARRATRVDPVSALRAE